jgi:hypothetical protein
MPNPDISSREPDPLVETLKGASYEPREGASELPGPTLVGFFQQGDEEGQARLYFPTGARVQFKAEDVVAIADVPPEQSPVLGERATAIRLTPDARMDFIHKGVGDEFDLEIQAHGLPADYLQAVSPIYYSTGICSIFHSWRHR